MLTGTDEQGITDGEGTVAFCVDWTSSTSPPGGTGGFRNEINTFWTNFGELPCAAAALYCFQD